MPGIENFRVLIIGTSKYHFDKAFPSIENIQANLKGLKDVLTSATIFNIPAGDITDRINITAVEASDVIKEFIGKNNTSDSSILFYYGGHGIVDKTDSDRPWYMTTTDSRPDNLDLTAISISKLRKLFSQSKAKRKIFIFDSCYSGEAVKNLMSGDGSSILEARIQEMKNVGGCFAIAATKGSIEAEFDKDDLEKPTDFTNHLLQVLREGLNNNKPECTINEIFEAVHGSLEKENKPIPVCKATDQGWDIPFVINVKYKPYSAAPRESLDGLSEDDAFFKTDSAGSIEMCMEFMSMFPYSDYADQVNEKMHSMQEINAWNYALKQGSEKFYQLYLKKYPAGRYRKIAENKLKQLGNEIPSATETAGTFSGSPEKKKTEQAPDISSRSK